MLDNNDAKKLMKPIENEFHFLRVGGHRDRIYIYIYMVQFTSVLSILRF